MKSTVAPLEENKVRLSVEIDVAEFDQTIDEAFKKIAKEVRLPGFRPGKAPRKLLEAHVGLQVARAQALQDGIPQFLAKAVKEHSVDLIAPPDIKITAGEEDGPVSFDAECEVRPEIQVPGYAGLKVQLDSLVATEEELETTLKNEMRRHGALTDVDRAAAHGDFVVLDIAGTRDGEPVPGLNTDDWTYEVGRGWVAPNFDDQLVGAKAGDELKFVGTPNGTEEPADFEVKVQRVQELVSPELTDEWVSENVGEGEITTVDQYKDSIRERLSAMKANQVRSTVVDKVAESLAGLVDVEAPKSMVDSDMQQRLQNTLRQFQSQGIALDQWLSVTGQTTDDFIANIRTQSERAVKVDLALRAIVRAEGIEVDEVDLQAEFDRIAMQVGEKAERVRAVYEKNDAIDELTVEISKTKALDWLLHNVEMVDPEGNKLENDDVLGHDHSHDHSHDGEHDHNH